jgi:hypothetical protein
MKGKRTNHRDAENAEGRKREVLKLGKPSKVSVTDY